jgi:hypothetical protein
VDRNAGIGRSELLVEPAVLLLILKPGSLVSTMIKTSLPHKPLYKNDGLHV